VASENGNEPSGSIKGGKFLDHLSVLVAFEEGPCTVVLDSLLFSMILSINSDYYPKQHHPIDICNRMYCYNSEVGTEFLNNIRQTSYFNG
jgi:hypothetical protein